VDEGSPRAPDRGRTAPVTPGLGLSLAVSVVAHGFVLVVALYALRLPLVLPARVFPVSLVEGTGGGGDDGGAPPAPAATPAPVAEPAPAPPPEPRPATARHELRPPPARAAAPPAAATAPARNPESGDGEGTGSGGSGGGSGNGDGVGDGGGAAGVAYGANPLPPYPMVARRMGMQGLVELEVLVAPDGHATEVRIRRSSGFAQLDDAAAKTVRERWRFVPARRGSTAIESRVTVPIVFRLDDPDRGPDVRTGSRG